MGPATRADMARGEFELRDKTKVNLLVNQLKVLENESGDVESTILE